MNKKDFTIVILLALLIPAWMFIDQTYIAPRYATPIPPPSIETTSTDETPLVPPPQRPLSAQRPHPFPSKRVPKKPHLPLKKQLS